MTVSLSGGQFLDETGPSASWSSFSVCGSPSMGSGQTNLFHGRAGGALNTAGPRRRLKDSAGDPIRPAGWPATASRRTERRGPGFKAGLAWKRLRWGCGPELRPSRNGRKLSATPVLGGAPCAASGRLINGLCCWAGASLSPGREVGGEAAGSRRCTDLLARRGDGVRRVRGRHECAAV